MARSSNATMAVTLLIVVALAVAVYIFYNPNLVQQTAPACRDPDSISSHIYNPSRLVVVRPCITVSGTVDRVLAEDDGDYHVRLHLDGEYANFTNSANDMYQYGDLVVEIICARRVTQQSALAACENYVNQIPIPKEDEHITVSGPYVLDSEHHYWAEIHPVYSLTFS